MSGVSFYSIKLEKPEQCPICWDSMSDENAVVTHKVRNAYHTFHESCVITTALSQNPVCPLCCDKISSINGKVLAQGDEEESLVIAAKRGDLNAVRELLSKVIISEEARGRAVWRASWRGYLSIVRELLSNHATISRSHRQSAIFSSRSHIDIVRELLNNISEEDRGLIVFDASGQGYLDVVRELLSNHATISEKHRGRAVWHASWMGHLDIVRELLNSLSEKDRGLTAIEAAENNHLEIIKLLLASGEISIRDRIAAIGSGWALGRGRLEMARLLMPNAPSWKSQVALLALGVGALSIYLNQASGESS